MIPSFLLYIKVHAKRGLTPGGFSFWWLYSKNLLKNTKHHHQVEARMRRTIEQTPDRVVAQDKNRRKRVKKHRLSVSAPLCRVCFKKQSNFFPRLLSPWAPDHVDCANVAMCASGAKQKPTFRRFGVFRGVIGDNAFCSFLKIHTHSMVCSCSGGNSFLISVSLIAPHVAGSANSICTREGRANGSGTGTGTGTGQGQVKTPTRRRERDSQQHPWTWGPRRRQ